MLCSNGYIFAFCALKLQPMATSRYLTLYTIFVKLFPCFKTLDRLKAGNFVQLSKAFNIPRISVAQCFKLKFLTVFLRTISVQQHEV